LQISIEKFNVGTLKGLALCVGRERKGEAKGVMGPKLVSGFWNVQSQMNRMFNEMLGNLGCSPGRQLEGVTEWAPAIDATTKDGNLVIRAELPGVKPEEVDSSFQNNILTISGERKYVGYGDSLEEQRTVGAVALPHDGRPRGSGKPKPTTFETSTDDRRKLS
jgi:HSP20 family molecular chaperone IbpA